MGIARSKEKAQRPSRNKRFEVSARGASGQDHQRIKPQRRKKKGPERVSGVPFFNYSNLTSVFGLNAAEEQPRTRMNHQRHRREAAVT